MCFKEWTFWMYEKDSIQGHNWFQCPSCEIYQHSCHVDGNAKLYRYLSSGRRKRESYYKNCIFYSNHEVNAYIKKLYDKKAVVTNLTDFQCGGIWNAAKNVKRNTASLDETGLELASCWHRITQKALNLFQGELFGYPLYILENFMKEKSVNYCYADVICKLWKFVESKEPELTKCIKPALSVMHAKGHALNCQVLWSGDWIKGTRKSTGEETEQFFSFFSRCANTTKYQTPKNREEALTVLASFLNKQRIINLPPELNRRFNKNNTDLASIMQTVTDLKSKAGLEDFESHVENWINELKLTAKGISTSNCARSLQCGEKLVLLVHNLQYQPFLTTYKDLLTSFMFPEKFKLSECYKFLEFEQENKLTEVKRLLDICDIYLLMHIMMD